MRVYTIIIVMNNMGFECNKHFDSRLNSSIRFFFLFSFGVWNAYAQSIITTITNTQQTACVQCNNGKCKEKYGRFIYCVQFKSRELSSYFAVQIIAATQTNEDKKKCFCANNSYTLYVPRLVLINFAFFFDIVGKCSRTRHMHHKLRYTTYWWIRMLLFMSFNKALPWKINSFN